MREASESRELDRKIGQMPKEWDLTALYPELFRAGQGEHLNSTAKNVLVDLMTAPMVVVDLSDGWKSEADLIRQYGVDVGFLRELWDDRQVEICINTDAGKFNNHEWLMPILNDSRLIFRAMRTKKYFRSKNTDFEKNAAQSSCLLYRILSRYSSSQINLLSQCWGSGQPWPLNDVKRLSQILALKIERVRTITDASEGAIHRFLSNPMTNLRDVRYAELFNVTPMTAGLGGIVRLPQTHYDMLSKNSRRASPSLQIAFEGVRDYVAFRLQSSQSTLISPYPTLTADSQLEFWRTINSAERIRIRDFFLKERDARCNAARAHRLMGELLISSDSLGRSFDEIRGELEALEDTYKIWERRVKGFFLYGGIGAAVLASILTLSYIPIAAKGALDVIGKGISIIDFHKRESRELLFKLPFRPSLVKRIQLVQAIRGMQR